MRVMGLVFAIWLSLWAVIPGAAAEPVVRAVLFFSPTCPHCHKVMTEDLPPLQERFGDQLQIAEVNVLESEGQELYNAAIHRFGIPPNRRGVPTLIVGDQVLVGSMEIPERFPRIIEEGLAAGGIDWPDIPGFVPEKFVGSSGGKVSLAERIGQDMPANAIAIVVLVAMVLVFVWVGVQVGRGRRGQWHPVASAGEREWVVPALSIAGLAIALYLSYVEIAHASAVCGPVGNCNTVQQSPYAHLFGVIPIGILGVAGYAAILAAWGVSRWGQGRIAERGRVALLAFTALGVLFSIYLTFLEPFVIGATCVWCLASAIIMTALLWLVWQPGLAAWLALSPVRRKRVPRRRRARAR